MIFNRLVEMLEKHPAAKADCSEERKQNVVAKTKCDEEVLTCLRLISSLFQLPSKFKILACQQTCL